MEYLQIISSVLAAIGGILAMIFTYKNKIDKKKYIKREKQLSFYIKQSLIYYELENNLYEEIIKLDSSKNIKTLKIDTRKNIINFSAYKIESFKRPSNMKDLLISLENE